MVICLERGPDFHIALLMPLPLTVSCFSKIQTGFSFLVPAHHGSPGQRAVKWVCVCVCVRPNCNCCLLMRPVTDVLWSVCLSVSLSVCLSLCLCVLITTVNLAKFLNHSRYCLGCALRNVSVKSILLYIERFRSYGVLKMCNIFGPPCRLYTVIAVSLCYELLCTGRQNATCQ